MQSQEITALCCQEHIYIFIKSYFTFQHVWEDESTSQRRGGSIHQHAGAVEVVHLLPMFGTHPHGSKTMASDVSMIDETCTATAVCKSGTLLSQRR